MARYTSFFQAGFTTAQIAALKVLDTTYVKLTGSRTLTGNTVHTGGLDLGTSGTASDLDIYPTTASKGKFRLACTDQTGDTIAEVNMGAQAGARTFGIPDWSTKASADTEVSLAGIKVVADTTNRPGARGCLLYATGNDKLYVCTTASATAATWTVVGSQS